jgi:hypothetical protein
MGRKWLLVGLWMLANAAHAQDQRGYFFLGGWAYDITGVYTNTTPLDLQDDLGLRSTERGDYALAYAPAGFGWVPRLELGFTRIAADGQQRFTLLPDGSLGPVAGLLPIDNETVVDDYTRANDFELNARWPWVWGDWTVLTGLTVTHLRGEVKVADASNGQVQVQKINETFPLLSLGLEWQPVQSLRFTLSGDYVQYGGNRASELEARALWKFFGPVGLEGGYRQRRYKITDPMNELNARVAGARIGVVMEIPF